MANNNQQNTAVRPPIVVVMGHIDHGKSTLLDFIRKTNVTAGEAGGITQHVGSYEAEYTGVDSKKHLITFLDTPGHAAFFNIRERGAKIADIAILVVSAEDGVKPQTIEAYNSIKNQKIPFIVAITKIDKPNANITKAKESLGENEIYVEGWGGDVPFVPVSAVSGEGVNELLEMIMLVAEIADLKTNPNESASGAVIESSLDVRKGISATLIIKNGILNTGSFVVAGNSYAPIRYIENFKGEKVENATASMPVRIVGWSAIPASGTEFITVKNKKEAEKIIEEFNDNARRAKNAASVSPSTTSTNAQNQNTQDATDESPIISVPLAIKADVIGSLEGVKFELAKIKHDRVQINIVSEGIGNINENDVKLAQGDPNIILIGFNVEADKKASAMIERSAVPIQVKTFSIIYELSQFVQDTLTAKIPKEYIEEVTGRAKIMALFSKEKDRQVVGGKVETGQIETGNDVRIMRREAEIGRGKIRELQSKKLRVSEVAAGFEFGMMVEAKFEIAPGDKIESVRTVEKVS